MKTATNTNSFALLLWGVGFLKFGFGFGRDVPLQNLKVDPHKYQFIKQKWPIHIPIDQILSKIAHFFQMFLKILRSILALVA